jgi:hypothetical protein
MLTVTQSDEKLGLSKQTYDIIRHRKIAHNRLEGRIMLDEADLDAYVGTCRIEAGTGPLGQTPKVYKHLNPARMAKAWRARGVLPSP